MFRKLRNYVKRLIRIRSEKRYYIQFGDNYIRIYDDFEDFEDDMYLMVEFGVREYLQHHPFSTDATQIRTGELKQYSDNQFYKKEFEDDQP